MKSCHLRAVVSVLLLLIRYSSVVISKCTDAIIWWGLITPVREVSYPERETEA